MVWLPVDQNLPRHQKTIALARELGRDVSVLHATGLLVAFWGWAVDNARDGLVVERPLDNGQPVLIEEIGSGSGERWVSIGRALGLRRVRDVLRTISALQKTGWIDGDGRLHEWDQWGGKVVREREKDARRKALWREHQKGEHPVFIDGCRDCARDASSGRRAPRPADTRPPVQRTAPTSVSPLSTGPSTGQPTPRPGVEERRGEESRRTPSPRTFGGDATTGQIGTPAGGSRRLSDEELPAVKVIAVADTLDHRWGDALRAIRQATSDQNFVTWFRGTRLEGESTVVTPNAFAREWLEKHYGPVVREALGVGRVRFVLEGDLVRVGAAQEAEEQEPPIPEDSDG